MWFELTQRSSLSRSYPPGPPQRILAHIEPLFLSLILQNDPSAILGAPRKREKKKRSTAPEDVLITTTQSDEKETEDGHVYNPEAVSKIRECWLYKQTRARQEEFTQYQEVSSVQFPFPRSSYPVIMLTWLKRRHDSL